ncbi:MAG: HsdM family class I SAM-dependent methyltransferase [Promethearchaeota archaeon]
MTAIDAYKETIDRARTIIDGLIELIQSTNNPEITEKVVKELKLLFFIGKGIKNQKNFEKSVLKLAGFLLFYEFLFEFKYNRNFNEQRLNILSIFSDDLKNSEKFRHILEKIKELSLEGISRDMIGRFFHIFLPYSVRKQLAAFYTHPSPAEILMGLLIESYDDTVLDPACGSGTLLVSAYQRKEELFTETFRSNHGEKMHKQFLEKDLMGIEIMPFAANLTRLNLRMQNVEQRVENTRITTIDALSIAEDLKDKGEYVSKEGLVIPKVDVIAMNPPYTAKERMSKILRESLKQNKLGYICGHLINLWGYFLALGDLLLKEKGRLGAIIPINIARGKASKKIRQFLLENYHIKYIIKPVLEMGFTEGTHFKDIILIAEKRKPKANDYTGFIFIKKKKNKLNTTECKQIAEEIRKLDHSARKIYKSDNIEAFFVDYDELNKRNMLEYIWASNMKSVLKAIEFLDLIRERGKDKLTRFKPEHLKEGLHTSPKGLSQLVFITDPLNGTRTTRSFLLFEKKDKEYVYFRVKGQEKIYQVNNTRVKKALRTMTGLKTMDITDLNDYLIIGDYEGFNEILQLSNYKDKNGFSWDIVKQKAQNKETHLSLFRRFSPYSKKIHLLSFFSEKPFIPSDSMKILKCENKKSALISCLFLNSIFMNLQFFINKQETTGTFTDIKQEDLINLEIIEYNSMSAIEIKKAKELFESIKNQSFISLKKQLKKQTEINNFKLRKELDALWFNILGLTPEETQYWIPKIYDLLEKEILFIKKTL